MCHVPQPITAHGGGGGVIMLSLTNELGWFVLPSVHYTLKRLPQSVVKLYLLLKGLGDDVVHFCLQFQQLFHHDLVPLRVADGGCPRLLLRGTGKSLGHTAK